MSIFSLKFLAFIIILLLAYFVVLRKYQWQCLLVFSYAFYLLVGGYKGLIFIVATTLTIFYGARILENQEQSKKKRTLILIMLFNFGILTVLKYGRFILSNFNTDADFFTKIGLPLGISFYTFQAVSYIIDVYRGKTKSETNLFKFALFVSYFPQILQGPISKFDELEHQLCDTHTFDFARFQFGAERILWGYFKKLVIADRIAILSSEIYSNYATEGYAGFTIFIGVLFYGVQIYADFSG